MWVFNIGLTGRKNEQNTGPNHFVCVNKVTFWLKHIWSSYVNICNQNDFSRIEEILFMSSQADTLRLLG